MECIAGGHAAHGEHLQLHQLAAKFRVGFEPVRLRFPAPRLALQHEQLMLGQTNRGLALADVAAQGGLADFALRVFLFQPREECDARCAAACGVRLLSASSI